MNKLFRWIFFAIFAFCVLCIAGVLSIDTIAKQLAEAHIRATTGMDVKIERVSVGLVSPTLRIENFVLYNTAEFGGSPCLDMPDLYIEYDRGALRARQIHLKLVRVNIADISIVKGKKGKLNFQPAKSTNRPANDASPSLTFAGLDTLNLTLGKARVENLDCPPGKEVDFAIKNQIFHNIKSEKDLDMVLLALAGKGGMDLLSEWMPSPAQLLLQPGESIKGLLNNLNPSK